MSKKILVAAVATFMFLLGTVLLIDLIAVLQGNVIPVSYPEYNMSWNDSPIVHYNVSRAANALVGMMSGMAFFGGTMVIILVWPKEEGGVS